jgi:hypothetical protein
MTHRIAELDRRNVDDIEALAVLQWISPAPRRPEEWLQIFGGALACFYRRKTETASQTRHSGGTRGAGMATGLR